MENKMFCFQCQETAGCKACTQVGVCGKKPEVAGLQDLLIYVTKGLSAVTTALREGGKTVSEAVNDRVTLNLFITITNANFDEAAIADAIEETLRVKEELLSGVADASKLPAAALWKGARSEFQAKAAAAGVGVLATENEDVRSLRELATYGLKGMAAYNHHANVADYRDEAVDIFMQKALAKLLDDSLSGDDLTALVLETGKYGVDVMALLDKANTETYGNPEITKVDLGVRRNPGILISGHDLKDLKELLASSEVTLRTYPKGAIVFHDGDMPHSLYILLKGEVHILKDTYSGRQIFISEIDRPGDMFGEVYEVLQRPYDMYVRAVTEVKLLEVSSHLFTLDIGDKPRRSALIVQKNLMKIFAGKAYGMHTKLKILASGTLREKIVRYLYPHVDAEGHVTLTVSRAFIAAYLAVSRPSLSRELGAMQRDGIIQATGRSIRITDMDLFESYL